MKNWRLSRKLTLGITLIVIICMGLMYATANKTLKGLIKDLEQKHMESVLKSY